jgi:hypothetical protein
LIIRGLLSLPQEISDSKEHDNGKTAYCKNYEEPFLAGLFNRSHGCIVEGKPYLEIIEVIYTIERAEKDVSKDKHVH